MKCIFFSLLFIITLVKSYEETASFYKTENGKFHFWVNHLKEDYFRATESCESQGMKVLEIKSEDDWLNVQELLNKNNLGNTREYWLNALRYDYSKNSINSYEWIDSGVTLNYSRFDENEPSNMISDKDDCVAMNSVEKDSKWKVIPCSKMMDFICYVKNEKLKYDFSSESSIKPVEISSYLNLNGYKFYVELNEATYEESKRICESKDMDMIEINSKEDWMIIRRVVNKFDTRYRYWLGTKLDFSEYDNRTQTFESFLNKKFAYHKFYSSESSYFLDIELDDHVKMIGMSSGSIWIISTDSDLHKTYTMCWRKESKIKLNLVNDTIPLTIITSNNEIKDEIYVQQDGLFGKIFNITIYYDIINKDSSNPTINLTTNYVIVNNH